MKTVAYIKFIQAKFRMNQFIKAERIQALKFVFFRELGVLHDFYRNACKIDKVSRSSTKLAVPDDLELDDEE